MYNYDMDEINYYLPEFYGNFKYITYLHDWMKKEPQYFYSNIRIRAAYGCFPGNIWNGGRVVIGAASRDDIVYAVEEYNKRGIAIRYTYTNPILEQWHVLDTYCNLCMRLAHNGKNDVLVNSSVLEEFLRENYPDYHYISSTTKCIGKMDSFLKELQKDYDLVVLDSALNHTDELFAIDHKDKIELIVNHYCADDCKRRQEHYRAVGEAQLEYASADFAPCMNINRSFEEIKKNASFIRVEEVMGKYYDAGFRHFKLDGRGFRKKKVLQSFAYYFAKPEFEELVLERLSEIK
ncbi:hypothetical protein [Eubacterium oxidoreducens]|uniref:Collagenase-like protease, PrtC family n=1 Tax=Eubacterium oxidoreducens TaxID=1732 RepID=A0A1G6B5G1_EUBOX|nr:hypothetical protein [Eubacterium oxidoreducens]SDB15822.1 hypothetical protein SAMN02910417_01192 [Eubacterium oxidoreducens]